MEAHYLELLKKLNKEKFVENQRGVKISLQDAANLGGAAEPCY